MCAPMIGRTISHYRILQELGAGGMGVVFAAEDVRLGRQVAIKFVPESVADDKQLFERLRSEARTASALNHPNICVVHDVGELDGRPFIVMELLEGQTLNKYMERPEAQDIETKIDLMIQICAGLHAAHTHGIFHRDDPQLVEKWTRMSQQPENAAYKADFDAYRRHQ